MAHPVPQDSPQEESSSSGKADWRVTIYEAWCKACGICVAFCPKAVFEQDLLDRPQIVRPDACTGCQKCVLHCPDFAITVDENPNSESSNGH